MYFDQSNRQAPPVETPMTVVNPQTGLTSTMTPLWTLSTSRTEGGVIEQIKNTNYGQAAAQLSFWHKRLILLGAYRKAARAAISTNLAHCFEAFPVLQQRRKQLAGSMSGGEQQMLAVGRALMSAPKILLVDEPSVGLAPILVSRMIEKIRELKEKYSLTVLMAEQNFNQAVKIADRGYIIVHGEIAFASQSAQDLRENELVKKYYLGI